MLKGHCAAVKLLGQLFSAGKGAVGHQNFVNARLQKMGCRELCHFTRAHQQGLMGMHVAEDPFGKLHSRIAGGNGAGGHGRFSANPLGH